MYIYMCVCLCVCVCKYCTCILHVTYTLLIYILSSFNFDRIFHILIFLSMIPNLSSSLVVLIYLHCGPQAKAAVELLARHLYSCGHIRDGACVEIRLAGDNRFVQRHPFCL